MRTLRKKKDKGAVILLRRRIIISVLLIVIAGFGTLAAVVLTKRAKADVGYDPYFTLSTGPSKIRIFQPLSNSVANESSFTASGTAPPNTTLTLKVDGVTKTTVTTDSKGAWTKSITGVSAGDHQLTASTSLGGPFSVIAATGYLPGYSIVDLTTNGLVSASTAGLGTAFGSIYYGSTAVAASDSVRINDSTVYLVRQRSVTILDVASQSATKTIFLAGHFSTGGESPQDSGELFKRSVLSADGSKLYLLYSSDTSSKILKIDIATGTLESTDVFSPSIVAGATGMVLTPDGSKLYVISYNAAEVDTVQTSDGSATSQALGASARDIAISPNGSTVYISEAQQDTNFYIATIDIGSSNFDDHSIDLGTGVSEPDTLYVSSVGDKFYVGNTGDSSLRVYDTNSKALLSTLTLSSPVLAQTKQIVENQDGSKIYIPLADDSIAVIDHANDAFVASILKPATNYSHINGLMFNNNKLYTTYNRAPDLAADLFDSSGNPTKLFSSLAVSDATSGNNVTATPITINGASAGMLSRPVATSPISLVNSVDFSVGDPITITSPTTDTTLDTATPTITGKGPKSKTIQLSINGGSAISVSVDSSGNWQKQVTLTKNKNNAIVAVYNNKRTQLVLPNTFVFGSDIAKNQLSVIDGKSGLETNPVTLPPLGVSSFGNAAVKINTGAAVNPSGQRYYVVNTDFSPIITDAMNAAVSGDTSQLLPLLSQLPATQLGGIDVYSSQTRQLVTRIAMPNGVIPVSMKVSPDGKKAMVIAYDIQQQIDLLNTPNLALATVPLNFFRVNLDNNALVGDKITMQFDFNQLASSDGSVMSKAIGSLVTGGLVGISNVGSYTANGTKFYTTNFSLGKLSIIDTNSGEVSELTLPNTTDYTALLSTTINPATNILYVSYMDVSGFDNVSGPSFVPGMMLINTADNSFIGKTALPGLPLFNFAVNSAGSKVYMVTVDLASFINTIGAGINNPQAVLIDSLPTFDLTVYEPATGNTTTRPISNTEVPFNLVLSPDNKQVFIPTIGQNVIHVYDVDSDTMDAGNAPIILGGISTALATTSNIGEVTLGSYNATASYFVPPDAPATVCGYNSKILADSPDCKPSTGNNTNTNTYKFLPSSTGATVSAQSLDIPKQTVQIIKDTAQQALSSHEAAVKGSTMRTWLVYIIYGAFVSILGATGYVIWRTDMLLGTSEEETYM